MKEKYNTIQKWKVLLTGINDVVILGIINIALCETLSWIQENESK